MDGQTNGQAKYYMPQIYRCGGIKKIIFIYEVFKIGQTMETRYQNEINDNKNKNIGIELKTTTSKKDLKVTNLTLHHTVLTFSDR